MGALSASRMAERMQVAETARYPVYQTETIYAGGFVCLNSTGYAIAGTSTSGNVFVGLAIDEVDNSAGSSGDLYVTVEKNIIAKMVGSGLAASDIGSMAYLSDDQTITTTPNAVPIGPIVRVTAATEPWVYLPPVPMFHDSSGDLLTSPRIATSILDANGNELWKVTATTTAINEITVANAAAGSGPTQTATGGDTNIPHTIAGKGTGAVILGQATSTGVKLAADQPILDSSDNELIEFNKVATAVNQIKVSNAATGNSPQIVAGGETNTGIDIGTRGTGIGALVGDNVDVFVWQKDGAGKCAFFAGTPAALQSDVTQTYSTEVTTVANPTSPAGGAGSGADATTFNGAQCDALRAEVIMALGLINKLVNVFQAYKLIGT